MSGDDQQRTTRNATDPAVRTSSRRSLLRVGAAAGLGVAGLGTASAGATQPGGSTPSVEAARDQLSHPDPAPEAVALYRYLHDVWGEGMLTGQQNEPWGIDEFEHVREVTGETPAVWGADFIHDDESVPVDDAVEHWADGGVTAIVWHWGVPGQETPADEYYQTLTENVEIDLAQVLEDGTDPNRVFWDELATVGDELERARDRGVPILWRPFHEFDGGWFWWGAEGPEFFVDLWETMHEYFTRERDLDNLVWLLPHADHPDPEWVPDESTFDLAGADTYGGGDSYEWLYDGVVDVHGEDRPIVMHECGRDEGAGAGGGQPPDPDLLATDDAWWVLFCNWHTGWLDRIEDDYLQHVYQHDLAITLDDLPADLVAEYGESDAADESRGGDVREPPDGPGCQTFGEFTACDVDGEGLHADFTGDGGVGTADVSEFDAYRSSDGVRSNPEAFDFSGSGDGSVTEADLVALFRRATGL